MSHDDVASIPKLLKAEQVAEVLDLPVGTVYQLVREEILPAVRIGRRVRFQEEVLWKWILDGGAAYEGGWKKKPD